MVILTALVRVFHLVFSGPNADVDIYFSSLGHADCMCIYKASLSTRANPLQLQTSRT